MGVEAALPPGFRDFHPEEVRERQYILETLVQVFELYGYQPIQTASVEFTETLLGKYGDEGEKLLFYILDSGDFLNQVPEEDRSDYRRLRKYIAHKALHYDLTVPLARYVAMNQHRLTLPFKRYQIQSVWRADRPQRGRFREFVQCDIDVVGASSLLYDLECIKIYQRAFGQLQVPEIQIHLNHRQLLMALAIHFGVAERFSAFCTLLDKLDKVPLADLQKDFLELGLEKPAYENLCALYEQMWKCQQNLERLHYLASFLCESEAKNRAIAELTFLFSHFSPMGILEEMVVFDPFLARGLDYYTGTIYEVKTKAVPIGSLGGGGRYDRLLESFGTPSLPCVGISFGLDRIHFVLKELNRFKGIRHTPCTVLIIHFDENDIPVYLQVRERLIQEGISADLYPEPKKLKKQLQYANKLNIPFVLFLGEEERKQGIYGCKHMETGEQIQGPLETIIRFIQSR